MTDPTKKSIHTFQELYTFYKSNTKLSKYLTQSLINEQIIKIIAEHEVYPAMLIWAFMQLRTYWLGVDVDIDSNGSFHPPNILQQLITERLLNMLKDIEHGLLTLTPLEDPNTSQPLIAYSISNGWKLTIYTRLYTWYHIDTFTTPDTIEFNPWFLPDNNLQDTLLAYDPPDYVQIKIYGFNNAS